MKRQRPQWGKKALCCGFLVASASGFNVSPGSLEDTTSPRTVHPESLALHFPIAPKRDGVELPPWLDRYGSEQWTAEKVRKEVSSLEFHLVEHGFSFPEIRALLKLMYGVTRNDVELLIGAVDFLNLVLSLLEDDGSLVSPELLSASVLHYVECVVARRFGVPELVGNMLDPSATLVEDPLLLPESVDDEEARIERQTSAIVVRSNTDGVEDTMEIDEEVLSIARGAARIKRAESLVQSMLGRDRILSEDESTMVRDLLLSCMDDWRSLALRVVASLYRLQGLPVGDGAIAFVQRSPETVRTAKDAMKIYSVLAERLGMHRLKSRIQEKGFEVLYTKQYQTVSYLYDQQGRGLEAMALYLKDEVSRTLCEDTNLVSSLADLHVTTRVKEPFSFWKKLMKKKALGIIPRRDMRRLSMVDVQDAVALRVVVSARKMDPDEDADQVRARERFLCYYAQHLIRKKWPAIDESRMKDYIRHPKPNGYQSLHHTAAIQYQGMSFPFEVQVRSEEMHRIAEFGVASHWLYKSNDISGPALPASVSNLIAPAAAEDTTVSDTYSYVDNLIIARDEMVREQVYVFVSSATSSGEGLLLSLANGSSIADAIDAMGKDALSRFGTKKFVVWRNGFIAKRDDLVRNGDVVFITE